MACGESVVNSSSNAPDKEYTVYICIKPRADDDFRIYENRRDNLPALSRVVATFSTFDSAADYLGALNNK
jgi:hypothetical protein